LSRTGHHDVAYRLLLQTTPPSFLYPVTMGATTIWERWDAIRPDGSVHATGMTSLNHYAFGAVADWLHRVVGGIQATAPGYRTLRIAPVPGGGLTWATATHDTPYGRVQVTWRDSGDGRDVEVTIPPGTAAEVALPDHPDGLVEEVGAGSHRWQYQRPVPPRFTLDTPFDDLRTDPQVWDAVGAVVARLWPGVDDLLEHIAAAAPDLAAVVRNAPDARRLEADLLEALDA
jgi:alpha-L-rhamnosidase